MKRRSWIMIATGLDLEQVVSEQAAREALFAGATTLVCGVLILVCGFAQAFLVNGFIGRVTLDWPALVR